MSERREVTKEDLKKFYLAAAKREKEREEADRWQAAWSSGKKNRPKGESSEKE